MTRQQLFGDSGGWADEDFIFPSSESTGAALWRQQPTQLGLPTDPPNDLTKDISVTDTIVAPEKALEELDDQDVAAHEEPEDDSLGDVDPHDSELYADDYEVLQTPILGPETIPTFADDVDQEFELFLGAEFDDALSEPTYELPTEIPDVGEQIWVESWLAEIEFINNKERMEAKRFVLGMGNRRVSAWLPWLRRENWNGALLVAFLRFRTYWDSNWDLWECLQYSYTRRTWYRKYNRNILSLTNTLKMTKYRLGFATEDVIDPSWFDDWVAFNNSALLDNRMFSFASFALYRSRLSDGEDWRRRPDLGVDFDAPIGPVEEPAQLSDFSDIINAKLPWLDA